MKRFIVSTLLILALVPSLHSQDFMEYEATASFPYGLPNPAMPDELLVFSPLIGDCNCRSVKRIDQETWADTLDMKWRFSYIMNGKGVQDQTWLPDGSHSGSIRQFIADSARWYVHYYSSAGPTPVLSAWEGNKTMDEEIILYRDQKALNGMEGRYKIRFYNISSDGFDWLGQWVTPDESIVYPTWKISCKKQKGSSEEDKKQINEKAKRFSALYMAGDHVGIGRTYTNDAKIFPSNQLIVEGQQNIEAWWKMEEGTEILHHETKPLEINILGEYAYDYGYYSGKSAKDGKEYPFDGKYMIVWQKINGDWKIYLDIWNRN